MQLTSPVISAVTGTAISNVISTVTGAAISTVIHIVISAVIGAVIPQRSCRQSIQIYLCR
jgi:tetrahydromethanopterin S-methyltransferase subunit C